MSTTLRSRALVWAAVLFAALVPYCSAFRYNQSRYGDVHAWAEQDIYSAEAEAMIKPNETEEGEVGQDPLAATSQH
jgi:hypothetical protein